MLGEAKDVSLPGTQMSHCLYFVCIKTGSFPSHQAFLPGVNHMVDVSGIVTGRGQVTWGQTGHRAAFRISYGLLLVPPSPLSHLLLKSACKPQLSRRTTPLAYCFLSSKFPGHRCTSQQGRRCYSCPRADGEVRLREGKDRPRTHGHWGQERATISTSGFKLNSVSLAPGLLAAKSPPALQGLE